MASSFGNTWTRGGTILSIALFGVVAHADPSSAPTKTLSPYFFVEGGDEVDRMPLKSTRVDFNITGVIADVTVRQTYVNEGKHTLHAKYVFPASTRAAVHGMKMTVGDHAVVAKIAERKKATEEFERARKEGKSAALLEEDRPNVFSMNLANILPHDRIEVELRYSEIIVPTEGTYEFVYPTVVGPRYANQRQKDAGPVVEVPYLRAGKSSPSTFSIEGNVSTAVPVKEMKSPSHAITSTANHVALASSEAFGGDRDFILDYRLRGAQIETGLSLYSSKDENFFLMMVEPPARVEPAMVPDREYVFIVDVSGSMSGFPLDVSKDLVSNLIGALRPTDLFNVLLFSGGSRLMSERSLPATPENIARARTAISTESAGGGTELLPALQRAMAIPTSQRYARSFIVITDGYISGEEEMFSYIREHLGQANVFSFGIGSSVNRFLIEGIAKAGMGEPFVVTGKFDEARAVTKRFSDYLRSPVLTNVRIKAEGVELYDIEPASIPTVFADRPVIVHGKWRSKVQGDAKITLNGRTGTGTFSKEVPFRAAQATAKHEPLAHLWARTRIANLSSEKQSDEITALGLKYNLLTAFTSFIAVYEKVRATPGGGTDVTQPVPLPEGVEETALAGDNTGVGAEPTLPMLLAVMLLILGGTWWSRRQVQQ